MNKLHFGGCLDELKNLVDLFKENIDDYKSSRYDEENTKIDFIDKFFKLLGWDMYNYKGYSEDFREVVREDKVIIQGRPKSPDYAFKIGKERQFFVEAKKPSVNIKEGVEPAFQVRRYAYTAGLPVSILTDFEEFSVYDTRIKPNKNDKASAARTFYCTYEEYEKNFDFLFGTFSKEAVLKGKLNIYTRDGKKKKGTQPIDKELLKQIEEWRTTLAKNIALRNKELDIYQLNEAVQKIIDRIIFLRMAEDRNTEVYNTLKTYSEQKNIYEILVKYFSTSNTKYNSGLFAIVDWLDKLIIDDKIFKEIITDLYYPNPYEFSVLPIEILGQIYEQFLGKTIRLTPSHQAKVEEKPEVRKAGGVYYTPRYIVDYIVANTVGKKLGVLGVGDGVLGIGDEGLGDGDRGLEENSNIVINERLENENISGTGRLERSDEPGGDDLSVHSSNTEGGKIRADEPDTEGGGIDTVEHSGRVRQRPSEGISLPSVGGKGIPDGSGDADNNSEPAKLSDKGKYKAALGQNANSRQTSYRPAKISTTTKTQYPKPKTLKILDPACGSGSFLVGAFNYLLNYHLEYYTDEKRKAKALKDGAIYQVDENTFRLTIREKRKILLNNIYGVDIDLQAVEVTKLSLLLKLMEGEIVESRGELFLKSISEALLPDLKDNIKCGNSLIGTDFYADKDMQLFNTHEQRKINCFDWEVEFPQVFGDRVSGFGDQGLVDSKTQIPKPKTPDKGFDCVIGNPPYIKLQTMMESQKDSLPYFKNNYISAASKNIDIYLIFLEKAHMLINKAGIAGYILPHKFFQAQMGENLRNYLKDNNAIRQIVSFGANQIFENATTYTCLFFIDKKNKLEFLYKEFKLGNEIEGKLEKLKFLNISTKEIEKEKWNFFDKGTSSLFNKLNSMPIKLKDITRKIFVGLQTSADNIYVLKRLDYSKEGIILNVYSKSLEKNIEIEREFVKPFLMGKDVKRYKDSIYNNYVIFPYNIINNKAVLMSEKEIINKFPLAMEYLIANKENLENRERGKFKKSGWWQYGRTNNLAEFDTKKIMTPYLSDRCNFTYDNKGTLYHTTKAYSLAFNKKNVNNEYYYLGVLNSKLVWFIINHISSVFRGGFYVFATDPLDFLPIKTIDFSNKAEKAQHDRMVNLVEQMLEAQKEAHCNKSKTETDKKLLQQRIDIIDKQIDAFVYELYGLTEEEIRIVEGKVWGGIV